MSDTTFLLWRCIAQEADLNRSLPLILSALQNSTSVKALALMTCSDKDSLMSVCGVTGESADVLTTKAMRQWVTNAHQRNAAISVYNDETFGGRVICMKLAPAGGLASAAVFVCSADVVSKTIKDIEVYYEPLSVALVNHIRVSELYRLRKQAEAQREGLVNRMGRDDLHNQIVGAQDGLSEIMQQVSLVAPADSTALILGETGSGKEVIARAIHQQSSRHNMPFIRVNCGAMPPEMMDSELFGHEKGSFTGAGGLRRGWFERADQGTLFLDEIGELPMAAQVRLLRVIQEGTLTRVGAEKEIHVNVRIIAATHRNLLELVKTGQFREDLWYRLNVFPLYLPSLKERLSDIPALAHHFAVRAAKKLGLPFVAPDSEQIALLSQYDWPGNVREMQVVIERAAILGRGVSLELSKALGSVLSASSSLQSQPYTHATATRIETMDDIIVNGIKKALNVTNGRVEGQYGAAKLLAVNPNTLRSKMRKYGIAVKKVIN